MAAPLDLDQLQTFITISDTGSFTRAADEVHRTQSAVSMQMRRLEERIGKPLFEKDGRTNRLTEEGERLLTYARRMLHLNRETLAAFDDRALEGTIRIGTPDDYADRFLPEIMARFARSNPRVELTVICEPTPGLVEHIKRGNLDLAHRHPQRRARASRKWCGASRCCGSPRPTMRRMSRTSCRWPSAGRPASGGASACDVLDRMNRDYRILFTSLSATVITAAVLSGLAISVLPECALRPGMRVLGEADGFGALPDCKIGIMRGHTARPEIVDAHRPPHLRQPRQHLRAGGRGSRQLRFRGAGVGCAGAG